jgi:hypothetical protein
MRRSDPQLPPLVIWMVCRYEMDYIKKKRNVTAYDVTKMEFQIW